ncbi:MAG: ABC transporter substrate-binding protein [Acidimicrobiia bacterium]|nr:ABC transporter substrate-binding protein [Acidimicrobiia bacterium]
MRPSEPRGLRRQPAGGPIRSHHGPLLNRPESIGIGDLRWLGEQFPEATQKIGILTAGVAATLNAAERARESIAHLGWEIVYDEKYNAAGEASWRGFAEGLRSSGARGVIWVADPGNLAALLKSMDEIEYHPDFVRGATNLYDTILLSEAGEAADNVYISGSSYPFLDPELAAQNPATQQYLDIMDEYDPGGKIADLGIAAFSAWLLFARSASACGDELTRDCVWAEVVSVRDWSGGGLHATQDLTGRRATGCFVEIEASHGEFVLPDIGANDGVYLCDPENVIDLDPGPDQGVKCENPAFSADPRPSTCAP